MQPLKESHSTVRSIADCSKSISTELRATAKLVHEQLSMLSDGLSTLIGHTQSLATLPKAPNSITQLCSTSPQYSVRIGTAGLILLLLVPLIN